MTARIGWRALARYLAGESPPEESQAIHTWAEQDGRHAQWLDSARRAWETSARESEQWDTEAAWRAVAGRIDETVRGEPGFTIRNQKSVLMPVARQRSRVHVLAWAATIAMALAVPIVWSALNRRGADESYVTAANEQRTVRLEDGSVVRLAGGTRLRVAPAGRREAWLEGTAFFGIAERNGEAFVVHTPAGQARVLGTRFELRADQESVRLAVLEGRVELTGGGGQELVQAGEVSQAQAGTAPSAPQPADVQDMVGWMGSVLIFQDTPLTQAAREIEQLYGIAVRITDAELGRRTVTAAFDRQAVGDVAGTVCRVVDARCQIQDTVVVVSR